MNKTCLGNWMVFWNSENSFHCWRCTNVNFHPRWSYWGKVIPTFPPANFLRQRKFCSAYRWPGENWGNLKGFSFQVSSKIINKHILFQFSRTKTNIFAATKSFRVTGRIVRNGNCSHKFPRGKWGNWGVVGALAVCVPHQLSTINTFFIKRIRWDETMSEFCRWAASPTFPLTWHLFSNEKRKGEMTLRVVCVCLLKEQIIVQDVSGVVVDFDDFFLITKPAATQKLKQK